MIFGSEKSLKLNIVNKFFKKACSKDKTAIFINKPSVGKNRDSLLKIMVLQSPIRGAKSKNWGRENGYYELFLYLCASIHYQSCNQFSKEWKRFKQENMWSSCMRSWW